MRRILPVSDSYRRLALEDLVLRMNSFKKSGEEIPLSKGTEEAIYDLYTRFKKEVQEKWSAKGELYGISTEKKKAKKRLKYLLTHFLTIFNMRVRRGESHSSERILFGMDSNDERIPEIKNEDDLTYLSITIIDGEKMRLEKGRRPMVEISVEDIKKAFNEFSELVSKKHSLSSKFEAEDYDLTKIRKEANKVIKNAWDEIDFFYRNESTSRKKSSGERFGVQYTYRKRKKKKQL